MLHVLLLLCVPHTHTPTTTEVNNQLETDAHNHPRGIRTVCSSLPSFPLPPSVFPDARTEKYPGRRVVVKGDAAFFHQNSTVSDNEVFSFLLSFHSCIHTPRTNPPFGPSFFPFLIVAESAEKQYSVIHTCCVNGAGSEK